MVQEEATEHERETGTCVPSGVEDHAPSTRVVGCTDAAVQKVLG